MWPKHDWFWFCFSLAEKVARVLLNQSQSVVKQNQSKREITFDIQLKNALNPFQKRKKGKENENKTGAKKCTF